MESSCNKLFRTELLEKNGIRFNASAVVFEDFQFVLDYLSACAPGISLVKRAFYHYRAREEENGAAKRSRFNLVQDIDMLAAKFLAWTDTLALPQEDVPVVKGYILQKINVIFHALQQQPYAARKAVFRDFLSSGLATAPAGISISVQCIPRASSSRFMQDRLSGSVLLFEARSTFFSSIGFFAACLYTAGQMR